MVRLDTLKHSFIFCFYTMNKQYLIKHCVDTYKKIYWMVGLNDFIHSINNMTLKEVANLSDKMEEDLLLV